MKTIRQKDVNYDALEVELCQRGNAIAVIYQFSVEFYDYKTLETLKTIPIKDNHPFSYNGRMRAMNEGIVLCYNYDFLYVIDEFDFSIIQMKVPYIFDSKTVEEINLRQKYNLNLIAIVHDGKATGNITPKTMLYSSDSMYICGTNKNITEFQDKLK